MDVYRPLRAGLFFYECLRLLLLAAFLFMAPPESSGEGAFFPYLVFLSSSALFPLMALFLWLRLEEYRSYLPLYMAGKIISVVLFFVWEIFTARQLPGARNILWALFLLGGGVFINLADTLSIWGAWSLNRKIRQAPVDDNGGL